MGIVMICGAVMVLYAVIIGIRTAVIVIRASKSGMIAYKFTASAVRTVIYSVIAVFCAFQFFRFDSIAAEGEAVISDAYLRGAAAFIEYEGWEDTSPIEEYGTEKFTAERTESYKSIAYRYRTVQAVCLVIGVQFFLQIFLSGFFLTYDGVYFLLTLNTKPVKCTAKVHEGKLYLYRENDPAVPFYKTADTDKNRKLLAEFLRESDGEKS